MFAPSRTATKLFKESTIIPPAIKKNMCAQKRSALRGEDRRNEEGAIRDENSCLHVVASTKATSVMLSKGGTFQVSLEISVLLFSLSCSLSTSVAVLTIIARETLLFSSLIKRKRTSSKWTRRIGKNDGIGVHMSGR